MRTRVLLAAATFAVVGTIAGCDRTTAGTVAMTTEPGSSAGDTSNPSPGDVLGVTCAEYVQLDPAGQTAVIEGILKDQSSVFSPGDAEVAKTLADAVCTFLPDSPVSEILLGGTPP